MADLSNGRSEKSERLSSLDAFRGFVILSMIFVNYLPGMKNIPGWLLHATAEHDGFTFTDTVFPGFLFIVGVAIPMAFARRLERGETVAHLMGHLLLRAGWLILLGVMMVNSDRFSAEHSLLSHDLWYLLAYLSILLLWGRFKENPGNRYLKILRPVAAAVLALLLLIFRGAGTDGSVSWLEPSWWGILGIIGWAYLVCGMLYLCCKGDRVALLAGMGLMVAISIGDQEGVFDSAGLGGGWINPGDLLGTHPAIVTAGMLVGGLFGRDSSARDPRRRIGFMAWFGTALCLAGFLLRPLHGFHKIGGTESWGLVTAGLCCLAFMLFYAVMDFWGKNSMLRPLEPIGKNPLLAYLLPDILGLVMGFTGTWYWFWPFWNQGGGVGLANAAVVTAGVLGLTWVLTRLGFVVRL